MSYYGYIDQTNYLVHHGIKGQKWGIRRYQNEDGSLTPAGRRRYGYDFVIQDPVKRLKSGNAYKGQARMYADVKKYVGGKSKSEIDKNTKDYYEKHGMGNNWRKHRAAYRSQASKLTGLLAGAAGGLSVPGGGMIGEAAGLLIGDIMGAKDLKIWEEETNRAIDELVWGKGKGKNKF
ncbi:MAG: hypothetical protein J6Y02_19070 [Pseudobutyrivibrio sp.]|nr:hypothetical protein [Pseudobutyrivibrio sp.]